MIHTVKHPFFCRKDQFKHVGYPGQVLVIGISAHALMQHNPYRFRIGNSPTVYSGDSYDAMRISYKWMNKQGKEVRIVPVDFFKQEGGKECPREECLIAA